MFTGPRACTSAFAAPTITESPTSVMRGIAGFGAAVAGGVPVAPAGCELTVVAGAVVVVVAVRSDAASKPGGGGAGFPLARPTAGSTRPRGRRARLPPRGAAREQHDAEEPRAADDRGARPHRHALRAGRRPQLLE